MRLSPGTTVIVAVVVAAAWIVVAASVVDRWTLSETDRILVDITVDGVFLLVTATVVFALVTRVHRREAQALAAAEHRRDRLDVMHALDVAILQATDPADFAVITARFLGQLVPCDRVSVGLWDDRREELSIVGSWVGTPPAQASGSDPVVSILPYTAELRSFAGLFAGGTARTVAIDALPGTSMTAEARAAGVRVYYLIPLLAEGGGLIATIGLGSREPDWFTPERRAVADEVASRLAVGVRHAVLRRQLEASERLFSDVFALIPTPVTLTGISGRVLAINDAALREVGVSRAEIVGKVADQFVAWVVPADRRTYLQTLTASGECHGFETSLRLADGRVVRELLSARLVDIEGEACILTAALDITERVTMEARLHQARKMEVMGQFASILAHDLRNYLNAVSWSADLLATEIDPADPRRRDVDLIRFAADGGLGMIRNVLGFARPEGNGVGATELRAHLGQIGGIVASLVGPAVAVEIEVPEGLPDVAISSAGVTQIIFNLAANARDAMPDGGRLRIHAELIVLTGAEPSATADPVVPGRFVRVTVADSGEGMDTETASRAFEAFYTTRDGAGQVVGTGLGLSSVYLIVTRAGGRVDLQSDPGVGTTFTIDLPALAA